MEVDDEEEEIEKKDYSHLTEEERWRIKCSKDLLVSYQWIGRAEKYNEGTMVFAVDKSEGKTGSKTWWAGSIEKWTDYILGLEPENRNGNSVTYEEDIVFGFTDLEFYKEHNPNHSMDRMMHTFAEYQAKVWSKLWPQHPVPTINDLIVLSASSHKKESKHTYGPFTCAFKNMYHLKVFYILVLNEMSIAAKNGDLNAGECIVTSINPEGKIMQVSFLDMAVYHHKGCLRMYKCTKPKENRPLLLDPHVELPEFIRNIPDEHERDRVIFKCTIPSAVPPGTPILEVDEGLVKKYLPKKAFQQKKQIPTKFSFALFTFPKSENPKMSTHFELQSEEALFRTVSEKSKLYQKLSEEKLPYCSHEIFTEETIFILEFSGIIPHEVTCRVVGVEHEIPLMEILQNSVHVFFRGEGENTENFGSCFVFDIGENFYRIYWPHISVEKSRMKKSLENLLKILGEKVPEIDWKKVTVDVYERGSVSLPFSWNVDFQRKQKKSHVLFLKEFDKFGKVTNIRYTKFDLLQLLSVRKG